MKPSPLREASMVFDQTGFEPIEFLAKEETDTNNSFRVIPFFEPVAIPSESKGLDSRLQRLIRALDR